MFGFNRLGNWFTAKKPEQKQKASPASVAHNKGLYRKLLDPTDMYLSEVVDPDIVLQKAGLRRKDLYLLLTDPDIYQAVDTRRAALLGVDFYVSPAETKHSEFLEVQLEEHLDSILRCAFNALLFGFSVAERIYQKDGNGQISLQSVRLCDIEKFRFNNLDELEHYYNHEWVKCDTEYKFLLTRNNPTNENPYGDALLSPLYWHWIYKSNTWKFLMMYLDRAGTPPLVVRTESDPKEVAPIIAQAYQDSILTLGVTEDAKFLTVGSHQQQFISVDAAIVEKILLLILGQTLTAKGNSGSYALGKVHNAVRKNKQICDVAMVRNTVKNVVKALCALNLCDGHEVILGDEVSLEEERTERDTKLYKVGVRFTRNYFENNTHLKEDEFEIAEDIGSIKNERNDKKVPENNIDNPQKTEKEMGEIKAAQEQAEYNLFKAVGANTTAEREQSILANRLIKAGHLLATDDLINVINSAKDKSDMQNKLESFLNDSWDNDPEGVDTLIAGELLGACDK